jgi:ABC-type transport system, involved in lipoprotein release, permease component
MNIMLVSVTERTREIGLRKAVGATRNQILVQFLIETVTLSLLGGIIGILLGVLTATIFKATGLIASVVTISSILMAFGFALAIGIFFGLYPAFRAANLHPMEALRYE